MTRYAEIEKALEACLLEMKTVAGTLRMYREYHGCIDQAKAALALPEDSNDSLEQPSPLRIVPTMTSNNTSGHQQLANSKTGKAELYGLAVELADEYTRLNFQKPPIFSTWSDFESRDDKTTQYLALRESSGEPMPYRVVRDGDKVRFE